MSKRNTRLKLSNKEKLILMAKTAGRCQFEGCNKIIYEDWLTKEQLNFGEYAHIIASSPNGPRGDKKLSKELNKDISNIMILCPTHHKLIDNNQKEFSVQRLTKMKEEHQKRIQINTSIAQDKKSHIIIYEGNIGQQHNPINFNIAKQTILPNNYPAENIPISLSLKGSATKDNKANFWCFERQNLIEKFNSSIKLRIENGDIKHCSLFALATIPLLIQLGSLLTDKIPVEIYQPHREPNTWKWQEYRDDLIFHLEKPIIQNNCEEIALILSLSANISNNDIKETLGENIPIWHLKLNDANNNFLQSKQHLQNFREQFRVLMNNLKQAHGKNCIINLFPAIPTSIAIEVGRCWMPKADLPITIYDRNRDKNLSFIKTFTLGK